MAAARRSTTQGQCPGSRRSTIATGVPTTATGQPRAGTRCQKPTNTHLMLATPTQMTETGEQMLVSRWQLPVGMWGPRPTGRGR